MKRLYVKPLIEVERYELNKNIASNCAITVSNGPAVGAHEQCSDYVDIFGGGGTGLFSGRLTAARLYNISFYEDSNCACYYDSGIEGYWQS